MAEKKRKSATATAQPPAKKSKKSAPQSSGVESKRTLASDLAQPLPSSTASTAMSKSGVVSRKTRNHASDFMSDEEDATKKTKKSKSTSKGLSLTADGTNGVVEHSEDENLDIATSVKPAKDSMMAEAERTTDAELEEEFGDIADEEEEEEEEEEEIDPAPALLKGFDSDSDDPAEDTPFEKSQTPAIPQFKKTSKKLRNAAAQKSNGPGTVYIGRIPHGFYEQEMRAYFAQFGTITRLRLSRNKRTGASKHFAFVEFDSEEVAKIVAETMDNYLMFGHILKCKFASPELLHPDVWKGANKRFRKLPHHRIAKQKEEAPKTVTQWEKKNEKERKRREKKVQQMKEIGYEFHAPELADPTVAMEKAKAEELSISNGTNDVTNDPGPVSEVISADKTTKGKQEKKDKKTVPGPTEPAVETANKSIERTNGDLIVEKKAQKAQKPAKKGTAVPAPVETSEKTKETKKQVEVSSKPQTAQPKSILKKSKKA